MRKEAVGDSRAFLIHLNVRRDARGAFARTWCVREFEALGLPFQPVQANTSLTKRKGSLRGLHYQRAPHEEAKLVRCVQGQIYDVIVDVRPGSPDFGRWWAVTLSADEPALLFIPEGYAHGFQTLTEDVAVDYLMGEFYTPEAYAGVRYDDPMLAITWPLAVTDISEQDRHWPLLIPGGTHEQGFVAA